MEIFKQGAEARLYKYKLFGNNVIVKERFCKKYRHPQLDLKLTHKRTLQEARAMLKCHKAGIKTPLPYFVDYETHKIYMEEINGFTLREKIEVLQAQNDNEGALKYIAQKLGKIVAQMHSVNVIHGDLTTSNILVETLNENDLTFTVIDFGLSFSSDLNEDFGVDLYVLERAFLSTHPDTEWVFQLVLDSYFQNTVNEKRKEETLNKLEEIRMRGRKRVMVG